MWAASEGEFKTCEALVKKLGADVALTDENNQNALYYAIIAKHIDKKIELVKLLLNKMSGEEIMTLNR